MQSNRDNEQQLKPSGKSTRSTQKYLGQNVHQYTQRETETEREGDGTRSGTGSYSCHEKKGTVSMS